MLWSRSSSIDRSGLGFGVYRRLTAKHLLAVMNQIEQVACLGLTPPPCEVFTTNLSARIDIGALANGHIRCRRYKGHGRLSRVVLWDPVGYRNVVGGIPKLDRDGTVQGEEELCSTIIEGENFGLG